MAETNTITQIVCYVCSESKTLDLFPKLPSGKHGVGTTCKSCRSAYLKQYRLDNLEKLKAASKQRYIDLKPEYQAARREDYQKNKERYKLKAKEWVKKNPEKRKQVAKRWQDENPEKRYQIQRNSRLANPGLYAAHYKARQQRKRQAMPFWACEESIKAMYRQAAWIQKVTGVKQHVDHYYPLKNDFVCGLHNEFNLRIIPAFDNLSKGNKLPE